MNDSQRDNYADTYDEKYGILKDYARESLFINEILKGHGFGPGSSLLDLACGTGTHICQLAKMGYDCSALDLNPEMLEKVREKAEKSGVTVTLYQGDMRRFDLHRRFSAVLNMFYSFQDALRTEEDQKRCLKSIRSSLQPGGLLIIELLPEENNLRRYPVGGYFEIFREEKPDGVQYVVSSTNRLLNDDLKEIIFTFTWSKHGKVIRETRSKTLLRRMPLETIQRLFREEGFTFATSYGDYSLDVPFNANSEKMIAVFTL